MTKRHTYHGYSEELDMTFFLEDCRDEQGHTTGTKVTGFHFGLYEEATSFDYQHSIESGVYREDAQHEALVVVQSYHGSGGKDGYKFAVHLESGPRLGHLDDFPVDVNLGDKVKVNGLLYEVTDITVEDKFSRHEVIEFELSPFRPHYCDLGPIFTDK